MPSTARVPASEMCHCGKPLHYISGAARAAAEKLITAGGTHVLITAQDKTGRRRGWLVPRHYLILHAPKAQDLPDLGFEEYEP